MTCKRRVEWNGLRSIDICENDRRQLWNQNYFKSKRFKQILKPFVGFLVFQWHASTNTFYYVVVYGMKYKTPSVFNGVVQPYYSEINHLVVCLIHDTGVWTHQITSMLSHTHTVLHHIRTHILPGSDDWPISKHVKRKQSLSWLGDNWYFGLCWYVI